MKHDEECHCKECETCFHCGKRLGVGNNDCTHCINEKDLKVMK